MNTPLGHIELSWVGDGPRLGMITAINGTNPGPASGITYDVAVNEPTGVVTYLKIVPANARPADTIDTKAAPVNTGVWVYSSGQKMFFLIPEFPDWGTCT